VTEAEWLACDDPQWMLDFLQGKGSDRKVRLFAVACCSQVWHFHANKECRQAIELSERAADDPSLMNELVAACDRVWRTSTDSQGFTFPAASRKKAAFDAAIYASTSKMWHVKHVARRKHT
jgi:hypothetical protein